MQPAYRACTALCASQLALFLLVLSIHGPAATRLVLSHSLVLVFPRLSPTDECMVGGVGGRPAHRRGR